MITNESILKEITEATKLNKEATRIANEALCHAYNVINNSCKAEKQSFESGYNKAVEDVSHALSLVFKPVENGGLSDEELQKIFGFGTVRDIMSHYSIKTIVNCISDYERKEMELKRQAEKLDQDEFFNIEAKSFAKYLDDYVYIKEINQDNTATILVNDKNKLVEHTVPVSQLNKIENIDSLLRYFYYPWLFF